MSARRRPRRTIAVVLQPEEWDRLVRIAISDGRDPYDQARVLLLQGIKLQCPADPVQEESPAA